MSDPIVVVILASLIIFLAFYTRSLFGFGGALISIPLLTLLLDLKLAVPLEAIFEVILSILLIKKEYKQINWKILIPILIGAAVGTLLGTYVLKSFVSSVLQKMLGVVIILFSINLLVKPTAKLVRLPKIIGVMAGVVGGILGGMFGTSGPPFVLFLNYQIDKKEILRATLIGLFTIDFAWRLIVFGATGLLTMEVFYYALLLTPALILGTILGANSFFKLEISEHRYRQLIALLLSISGILLLLK